MDDANGPLFGQHDELFTAISSADAEQQLKDFVLEMTASAASDSSGMGSQLWGTVPQRLPDPNAFSGVSNCMDNSLVNPGLSQRNFFQLGDNTPFDMHTDMSIFDLAKPMTDDIMLDGLNGLEAIKRSLMGLPERPSYNEQPASIHDTMHRLSTDNGTQEYLDSLSKPESMELKPQDNPPWNGTTDPYAFHPSPVNKQEAAGAEIQLRGQDRNGRLPVYSNGFPETFKYNSASGGIRNRDVARSRQGLSTRDLMKHDLHHPSKPNEQDVMDILQLTQPKITVPPNTIDLVHRELSQNILLKGLSPSISADSAIHTPTTSYESVSPLSSGRTPLRSDDSISPLASCASPATSVRTPRNDDCFSPGRVRRTPIRNDDTLSPRPVSRTPLRPDDVPSPALRHCVRTDDAPSPARTNEVHSPSVRLPASPAAPSPRGIARTPLRPDDAPSPRAVSRTPMRTDDALSPRGVNVNVNRTSIRVEDIPSPKPATWTPLRSDDASTGSPRTASRTPMRYDEIPSPWSQGRTPLRNDEALSPRATGRTPLRHDESPSPRAKPPTPLRVDEAVSPRGTSLNPPSKSEESVSPREVNRTPTHQGVNQLPLRAPFSPSTVRRRDGDEVADLQAGPVPVPVPKASPPAPAPQASPPTPLSAPMPASAVAALPGPSGVSIAANPKKRRKTESTSTCVPAPKKRCSNKMPIYQSIVSEEDSGIKLKIKLTAMPPPKRRRRKADGEDGEKKTKKKRVVSLPEEQSPWGRDLPPEILFRIFKLAVSDEGCVPSLVRFSWVCRLWNSVAAKSELWQNVDLSSPCIKQKYKIDRYFRWLLENRLGANRDLNLNGWKFSNLPMVLSLIGAHCNEIESIGMSGWQGLHYEHLRSLLQDCPRLARIDLSDVSPESKGTNSAVSPKSITYLTETMAERLTELTLAHNTLSCLPQIITSLASNCPNLEVLDLSNIRRASHAEFALHVEELQTGCPLLRVLRITNSCITIAHVPFDQQAASAGFPALEELSIAGHQGTESLRITSVMDDDCLERIVKASKKLRLLDVRGCTRITDSSLVRVPAWDIQHLFLSGCLVTRTGSGLELIAQKWSHSLVEIDLGWASVAEDINAAVIALSERGAESPLRVVNLCGSAVEMAPVKTLLMKCPQIESLNLQSCRGLPRGVKRLYENHQLPELLDMLHQNDESHQQA